jgi:hypothetical protein
MNVALQNEEDNSDQGHRQQAEPNHHNTKAQISPHRKQVNRTEVLCDVQFVPVCASSDLFWRPQTGRGQPLIHLSSRLRLPSLPQKLVAADAGWHTFSLLAQIPRLLLQAISERR